MHYSLRNHRMNIKIRHFSIMLCVLSRTRIQRKYGVAILHSWFYILGGFGSTHWILQVTCSCLINWRDSCRVIILDLWSLLKPNWYAYYVASRKMTINICSETWKNMWIPCIASGEWDYFEGEKVALPYFLKINNFETVPGNFSNRSYMFWKFFFSGIERAVISTKCQINLRKLKFF